MYKNIVVGYDESEYSKAALTEVSHWVKKHGGKVSLVHAVYFDKEEFAILPSQMEKRFEAGTKVCYQAKQAAASDFGIDVESLVCEGEPPDVIVDTAEGKNADLIALGTYGRKGLKRLLMGSVTSQVILDSPCDVLVVKKPCSKCTGTYATLLVPFDGSESGKKALSRAAELAKIDGAGITVLYVIPRYEEMIGFFKTESIKKSLSREADRILSEARKAASAAGVSIKTEIQEGLSWEKITEAASRLKADLVVMGSHGWRGMNKALMGSTAERVINSSPSPVLIVR